MTMAFREHDVVRVERLLTPTRSIDGTAGILRPPQVGDVGAVVHVAGDCFTVECVNDDGLTVWLADFQAAEIAPFAKR